MVKLINKIQDRVIKKLGIQKEPHIAKNFFYSVSLHLAAILIIYLSFNLGHKVKDDKKEKVVINFVMNGKAAPVVIQPALAQEAKKEPEKIPEPKKEEPKEEIKPEPKKEEKKAEPEKSEKKEKKLDKKKPEKKPEINKKKDLDPKLKDKEKKKADKPDKPDKKPEVKKEKSKKEEEKKEEPKKETKKEEPKKEISKESSKEDSKETAKNSSEPSFTEKTIDKLDLPVRDKFNIQSQIVGCYKRAIAQFGGNKSKETIMVNIRLSRDGIIDQPNMIFKDYDRYSNPSEKEFKRAVDIVKQTISFCSPLRKMPADKYDVWKEIDLQFSDSGIVSH